DDGSIAVVLHLLPGGGIVHGVHAADGFVDRLHAGHMLSEPVLNLLQEDVRVVETAIDQVHGLAVKRIKARSEGLPRNFRWVARRIEDGELVRHGMVPPSRDRATRDDLLYPFHTPPTSGPVPVRAVHWPALRLATRAPGRRRPR